MTTSIKLTFQLMNSAQSITTEQSDRILKFFSGRTFTTRFNTFLKDFIPTIKISPKNVVDVKCQNQSKNLHYTVIVEGEFPASTRWKEATLHFQHYNSAGGLITYGHKSISSRPDVYLAKIVMIAKKSKKGKW